MSSDAPQMPPPERPSVEMPRPNVWPMVLSCGIVLLAAGVALSPGFLIAGVILLVAGLSGWISQLLPGQGHHHEALLPSEQRARPVTAAPGRVEQLHPGRPGYRFHLPEKVHPVSAGLKGGLLGGLIMPAPALLWSLASGHGLFYPVNLLAGMVLPGVGSMDPDSLKDPHLTLFVVGLVIHAVNSMIFGLIYGVLLPTLPDIPRPLAWGALLMPLLWTVVSFTVMGTVNRVLAQHVSWPWFIFSQFLFGLAAALVAGRLKHLHPTVAGLVGGLAGGVLMPVPAVLWSLANRHGPWYPVNLLAGLVAPSVGEAGGRQLEQLHPDWLAAALVIHVLLSGAFGLVYGVLLPKLPPIPTSVAWGGLLMPLLWTGVAYSLMGVVNKELQQHVSWPWFIVSQFVFGIVAAWVVHQSEKIPVPPAGPGPRGE
jgi:hypothetical protein